MITSSSNGSLVSQNTSNNIDLVRRYGGPVSHSILDQSCQTFRLPGIDGFIGYHLYHQCAVAMGDPICGSDQRDQLAEAFMAFCKENGWPVIFAVASGSMMKVANDIGGGMLQVANLLVANPQNDPLEGSKGSHLRTGVRNPIREGVTIREYDGNGSPDALVEENVMTAVEHWRAGRRSFQMHIGSHHLFLNRRGCRWFLAEIDDRVVGVLYMMRINCAGCHYLIDLVFSTPSAPHHTNELLIVSAFKALRDEGETRVCLGVAPRAELGETHGFGTISSALARKFYAIANKLVPQHGKAVFWKKFGIVHQEPLYLMFQKPAVGIRELGALLKTFNFSFT